MGQWYGVTVVKAPLANAARAPVRPDARTYEDWENSPLGITEYDLVLSSYVCTSFGGIDPRGLVDVPINRQLPSNHRQVIYNHGAFVRGPGAGQPFVIYITSGTQ